MYSPFLAKILFGHCKNRNMKLDSKISARLRAARKVAGFSTSIAFCEKYNIPKSTYSQHETGKRLPKDDTLSEYADYLEISFNWLRFGKGSPFANKEDKRNEILEKKISLISVNESTNGKYAVTGIDDKLLAMILNVLLDIADAYNRKLNNAQISKAASILYLSLYQITPDPALRTAIIEAAVKTYMLSSER